MFSLSSNSFPIILLPSVSWFQIRSWRRLLRYLNLPLHVCVWINGLQIDDQSIKIIISIPDHVSSHPHTAAPLCEQRFQSSGRYSRAIFSLQIVVHNVFFPLSNLSVCHSNLTFSLSVCLPACVCLSLLQMTVDTWSAWQWLRIHIIQSIMLTDRLCVGVWRQTFKCWTSVCLSVF